MNTSATGLLLAAGLSRRFGNNKLLQTLADNTPMLIASAKNLRAAMTNCLAIVNVDMPSTMVMQLQQLGIRVIVHHHAENGIGSSIACGIDHSAQSSGWVIALADMPHIHPDTIRRLSTELKEGTGIVAPLYQQQRGHPVGFSAQYRAELLQLNADVGARHIIARHHTDLTLIEVQDRGVISDIDSEADLRAIKP